MVCAFLLKVLSFTLCDIPLTCSEGLEYKMPVYGNLITNINSIENFYNQEHHRKHGDVNTQPYTDIHSIISKGQPHSRVTQSVYTSGGYLYCEADCKTRKTEEQSNSYHCNSIQNIASQNSTGRIRRDSTGSMSSGYFSDSNNNAFMNQQITPVTTETSTSSGQYELYNYLHQLHEYNQRLIEYTQGQMNPSAVSKPSSQPETIVYSPLQVPSPQPDSMTFTQMRMPVTYPINQTPYKAPANETLSGAQKVIMSMVRTGRISELMMTSSPAEVDAIIKDLPQHCKDEVIRAIKGVATRQPDPPPMGIDPASQSWRGQGRPFRGARGRGRGGYRGQRGMWFGGKDLVSFKEFPNMVLLRKSAVFSVLSLRISLERCLDLKQWDKPSYDALSCGSARYSLFRSCRLCFISLLSLILLTTVISHNSPPMSLLFLNSFIMQTSARYKGVYPLKEEKEQEIIADLTWHRKAIFWLIIAKVLLQMEKFGCFEWYVYVKAFHELLR